MSGFVNADAFNASGKHHGKHAARNKKVIQIAKEGAIAGTPLGLTAQVADAASKGQISKQMNEPWSNVDGFYNAAGKKLTSTQKGAMIGFAALILTGLLIYGVKILSKHGKTA